MADKWNINADSEGLSISAAQVEVDDLADVASADGFDGDLTANVLTIDDTADSMITWSESTNTIVMELDSIDTAMGSIDNLDAIAINLPNCSDGDLVVYSSLKQSIECRKPQPTKEVPMNSLFTLSSVAFIILICLVTIKWIAPRVNWKTLIGAFFHLIYKPAKKEASEISKEWNEVKTNQS